MDVVTNEWYTLYERPKQIVESMIKFSTDVLITGSGMVPYMIPDHLLRERYLNAKKAFKINCKYICPLIDSEGNSVAVLTTMTAKLVSEGEDSVKIHMI